MLQSRAIPPGILPELIGCPVSGTVRKTQGQLAPTLCLGRGFTLGSSSLAIGRSLAPRSRLAAQTNLVRQLAALRSIVRRDQRVISGKAPTLTIFVGRQAMLRRKMPLEQFHLLAAFKASDMVWPDGSAN